MNDYYKLEESKKLIASIGDVGSTHKYTNQIHTA